MKKLRCKKEFGIWYYKKVMPSMYDDLDGAIYSLFNDKFEYIGDFAYYNDMKHYIEFGEML